MKTNEREEALREALGDLLKMVLTLDPTDERRAAVKRAKRVLRMTAKRGGASAKP